MKLLFCEVCGDILAPDREANVPRWCRCSTHAVWWVNPATGILRLYESGGQYRPKMEDYNGGPDAQPHWQRKISPHRAWVLGLHNKFLTADRLGKAGVKAIIDNTPDTYIFKHWESVIIRIRPGASNDTDWSEQLPGTFGVEIAPSK